MRDAPEAISYKPILAFIGMLLMAILGVSGVALYHQLNPKYEYSVKDINDTELSGQLSNMGNHHWSIAFARRASDGADANPTFGYEIIFQRQVDFTGDQPVGAVSSDAMPSTSLAPVTQPAPDASASAVSPTAAPSSSIEPSTPPQSPPPVVPEWHEVTTFDGGNLSSPGSSPETDTDTFVVGDRWRIVWNTKTGTYGDQGTLTAFIEDAPGGNGTASEGGIALAHSGSGSGDQLEYGGGQYYLKILANEPYHMRILSQ